VVEQLAHRCARSRLREIWDEARYRVVQPDLALGDQLQHCGRGELLDDRPELEGSVGRDCASGVEVGQPAPGRIKRLPAASDDHRGARPIRRKRGREQGLGLGL
jgi:hypothetical protein